MTLATIAALRADGRPMSGNPIRPLDPRATEFDGMPVLPEFCEGPVPDIERAFRPNDVTSYRFAGGEVGNAGVFTWSIGWRHPGVIARWRTEQDPVAQFGVNILVPAELAQLDLFVHKAFWPEFDPQVCVFSLLPGDSPAAHPGTEREALGVHITVDRLHEDLLDLSIPGVPNHARMFEQAFAAMGHTSSDFAGYRVRMKYPILPAAIYLQLPLPEKPRV